MEESIKLAIEEYQCSGCVSGCDVEECFEANPSGGIGCGRHHSGTLIPSIGKIFLGMPKGFDRLGPHEKMKVQIFQNLDEGWGFDKFNIPVWKYKNKIGHTLVRGIMPRRNEPFVHIFLEDCMDRIECQEITEDDINGMD